MRQSFNLFTKIGWNNFFSLPLFYRWKWQYVFKDTFGSIFCWFLGHKQYETKEIDGTKSLACSRCNIYLLSFEDRMNGIVFPIQRVFGFTLFNKRFSFNRCNTLKEWTIGWYVITYSPKFGKRFFERIHIH